MLAEACGGIFDGIPNTGESLVSHVENTMKNLMCHHLDHQLHATGICIPTKCVE